MAARHPIGRVKGTVKTRNSFTIREMAVKIQGKMDRRRGKIY